MSQVKILTFSSLLKMLPIFFSESNAYENASGKAKAEANNDSIVSLRFVLRLSGIDGTARSKHC